MRQNGRQSPPDTWYDVSSTEMMSWFFFCIFFYTHGHHRLLLSWHRVWFFTFAILQSGYRASSYIVVGRNGFNSNFGWTVPSRNDLQCKNLHVRKQTEDALFLRYMTYIDTCNLKSMRCISRRVCCQLQLSSISTLTTLIWFVHPSLSPSIRPSASLLHFVSSLCRSPHVSAVHWQHDAGSEDVSVAVHRVQVVQHLRHLWERRTYDGQCSSDSSSILKLRISCFE